MVHDVMLFQDAATFATASPFLSTVCICFLDVLPYHLKSFEAPNFPTPLLTGLNSLFCKQFALWEGESYILDSDNVIKWKVNPIAMSGFLQ